MPRTENRAYPRIDLKEKVKFGLIEPDTDGYSRNLSPEGMSIVSEKGLPTNSKICIQILCSSTAPIYIEGKVIWSSNPPGVNSLMGIKFTDSNDEILKIYKSRSRYK